MSLADYIILAVIVLAAVGAICYVRYHPCDCSKDCSSCGHSCARKKADLPNAGPEKKGDQEKREPINDGEM